MVRFFFPARAIDGWSDLVKNKVIMRTVTTPYCSCPVPRHEVVSLTASYRGTGRPTGFRFLCVDEGRDSGIERLAYEEIEL